MNKEQIRALWTCKDGEVFRDGVWKAAFSHHADASSYRKTCISRELKEGRHSIWHVKRQRLKQQVIRAVGSMTLAGEKVSIGAVMARVNANRDTISKILKEIRS